MKQIHRNTLRAHTHTHTHTLNHLKHTIILSSHTHTITLSLKRTHTPLIISNTHYQIIISNAHNPIITQTHTHTLHHLKHTIISNTPLLTVRLASKSTPTHGMQISAVRRCITKKHASDSARVGGRDKTLRCDRDIARILWICATLELWGVTS